MREHHFTSFRSGLLTALGLLQACGGQAERQDPLEAERAECIAEYPNDGSDAGALAAADCLSQGGTNCDSASFLSEAAAVCIAGTAGLADGLLPWEVGLNYHSEHGRVVWGVANTTAAGPGGGSHGESVVIDATTGFVLETLAWVVIPGRPFVVEHAARTAVAIQRSDYAAAAGVCLDGIAAEERAALVAEWTRVGLLEHASVAAFARFALQLLGLGAPPQLLEACQQAMQDELRHTRLAFGLASAYAGTPLGPGRLDLEHALDAPDDDLLAHVAMSTLVEGCIGETLAALDAREGASCATDPYVREVLAEIARDEERHAQLAWRFLDWALEERPSLALPLLDRARIARTASSLGAPTAASPAPGSEREASRKATLLQHGILPLEQRRELVAQAFEQVLAPCLLALVNKHARRPRDSSEHAPVANSARRIAQR